MAASVSAPPSGSLIFSNGNLAGEPRARPLPDGLEETVMRTSETLRGDERPHAVRAGCTPARTGGVRTLGLTLVAMLAFVLAAWPGSAAALEKGNYACPGLGSLERLTSGISNTACGLTALMFDTEGSYNTADGFAALYDNTVGGENVASGMKALGHNTSGSQNVATGPFALYNSGTGTANIAIGDEALYSNTAGNYNDAIGGNALARNVTGDSNVASGLRTMYSNSSGGANVAIGAGALETNSTGGYNVAIGAGAGLFLKGSYNVDISNGGGEGESGTIRIGGENQTRAFVAGIYGVEAPHGTKACTVKVTTEGQLVCKIAKKEAGADEAALVAEVSQQQQEVSRQQQEINELVREVEALKGER
jgi:hypothetical protein